MEIPFYRPSIGAEEIDETVQCLKSGWLTTGLKTKQFEENFSVYLRQKHAVAVNSCTAALHLALEAIGLRLGDQAVVPTMTFAATAEVVRYFNATPLLVDCREADFNLNVADAERRIEQAVGRGGKVVAILPVEYGGQIGDVAGVQSLTRRFGSKLIEDAAHCCPAYYKDPKPESTDRGAAEEHWEDGRRGMKERGRRTENKQQKAGRGNVLVPGGNTAAILTGGFLGPHSSSLNLRSNGWLPVGSSADITCFSFYANKCITTGEGGMACTQNDAYAERMRIMSLHGISKDAWRRFTAAGSWAYEIVAPGYKYNLTDIAAAIGIHQLRRADELHHKRTRCAALYSQLLADIEELILPRQQPDRIHSWHLYAIRLRLDRLKIDRAEVMSDLKQAGITASVHWMPLHMHRYYREKFGYRADDFPVAARLYPELITLPLYPEMTEAEITYVCDKLRGILLRNLKPMAASRPRDQAVRAEWMNRDGRLRKRKGRIA